MKEVAEALYLILLAVSAVFWSLSATSGDPERSVRYNSWGAGLLALGLVVQLLSRYISPALQQ
jgi:hypothetical protein